MQRDIRAQAPGLSGLRTAVASMSADAAPAGPAGRQLSMDARLTGLGPAGASPSATSQNITTQGAQAQNATTNTTAQNITAQDVTTQDTTASDATAPTARHATAPAPRRSPRQSADRPGFRNQEADSLRMLALVELAQDGDGEAFGQLYDSYSDTVYRYIYYRVSSRQLAEDLTSETFLRALRRISTFTWQGRDFGAWLVTIARNLVADHFKSSRYRLEVPTGEMLDSDETSPSPEESVLAHLSNRALLDAVRQLNAQQQECVTLRFLQGLSVAETAKVMGKNDGAIKTLQYRAIRTLARLLPADAR